MSWLGLKDKTVAVEVEVTENAPKVVDITTLYEFTVEDYIKLLNNYGICSMFQFSDGSWQVKIEIKHDNTTIEIREREKTLLEGLRKLHTYCQRTFK